MSSKLRRINVRRHVLTRNLFSQRRASDLVHFLSKWDERSLELWSPDSEPERYATGHGHTVLELYARLRNLGLPVSIGSEVPAAAAVVVTDMGALQNYDGSHRRFYYGLRAAAISGMKTVLIRNDFPLSLKSPPWVTSVIAPNPSALIERNSIWLPLLPQRGIRTRFESDSYDQPLRVALKSNMENIPEDLLSSSFIRRLKDAGGELNIHSHPHDWPSFEAVDIALCTRRQRNDIDGGDLRRKPATKMINAWIGGAIPLIGDEPAYRLLARVGVDAVPVNSTSDIIDSVEQLKGNPIVVREMRSAGAQRAQQFSVEQVLSRWWQAFDRIMSGRLSDLHPERKGS